MKPVKPVDHQRQFAQYKKSIKSPHFILNTHLNGVSVGDMHDHIIEAMEEYAAQFIQEKPLGYPDCPADPFEHNKSIFYIGMCRYCYRKNVL